MEKKHTKLRNIYNPDQSSIPTVSIALPPGMPNEVSNLHAQADLRLQNGHVSSDLFSYEAA